MLRHRNDAREHRLPRERERGEAGSGDVVITPFETEMLGALAEMLGVLMEAAPEPARQDRAQA
jgi:hypothetical protein